MDETLTKLIKEYNRYQQIYEELATVDGSVVRGSNW